MCVGLYMIELGYKDLLGDSAFFCQNVGLRLCSCCLSWCRVSC
jgi:hypothetical protein